MSKGPLGLSIPGPAVHQHQLIPGPAVDWTTGTVPDPFGQGDPQTRTIVAAVLFSCPCGYVLVHRIADQVKQVAEGG